MVACLSGIWCVDLSIGSFIASAARSVLDDLIEDGDKVSLLNVFAVNSRRDGCCLSGLGFRFHGFAFQKFLSCPLILSAHAELITQRR